MMWNVPNHTRAALSSKQLNSHRDLSLGRLLKTALYKSTQDKGRVPSRLVKAPHS